MPSFRHKVFPLLIAILFLPTPSFAGGTGSFCAGRWCQAAVGAAKWGSGYHWWGAGAKALMEGTEWVTGKIGQGYRGYAGWVMGGGTKDEYHKGLLGMGDLSPEENLALDIGEGLFIEGVMGLGGEAVGGLATKAPAMMRGLRSLMPNADEIVRVRNAFTGAIRDVRMGEAGAVFGGKVGNVADNMMTAALPQPVNPVYSPELRAAPSWKNTTSAIERGDLIKTVNYNRSNEAAIQLERMAAEGPHNFVIVPKGSNMELRVASQKGTGVGVTKEGRVFMGPEIGVKHIQLANGKPIIAGGTIRVTRDATERGGISVQLINNTGTYGPNMPMTPERIQTTVDFVREMFHYQADEVVFTPFVR